MFFEYLTTVEKKYHKIHKTSYEMHVNWGKPIFCTMDKTIISPQIEWCIGKPIGLCKCS